MSSVKDLRDTFVNANLTFCTKWSIYESWKTTLDADLLQKLLSQFQGLGDWPIKEEGFADWFHSQSSTCAPSAWRKLDGVFMAMVNAAATAEIAAATAEVAYEACMATADKSAESQFSRGNWKSVFLASHNRGKHQRDQR